LKQSGYTKLKNRLGFKDWFENIKNNVQNGKQLHASNMEENVKRMSEYIDKTNESIANFLVERGHSEERVAEIVEKNMEIQEKISRKKLKK
jgi:hemerythrin-like domain-containing protein